MPKITHHSVDSDLKEYVKIKPDLDGVKTQLAESANKNNSEYINVLFPPPPLSKAKGDGTDETTVLQAILDYCTTNGRVFYVPFGYTFTVNGLLISSKSNFGIDVLGTLKRKNSGQNIPILKIDTCSNFKILNYTTDGNVVNNGNTVQEGGHSLSLLNSSDFQINKIIDKNPLGDTVYINHSDRWHINFVSSYSDGNTGRNGVSIIAAVDWEINQVISINTGHSTMPGGVDLEPNVDADIIKNGAINYALVKTSGSNGIAIVNNTNNPVENVSINGYVEKNATAGALLYLIGANRFKGNITGKCLTNKSTGVYLDKSNFIDLFVDINSVATGCILGYTSMINDFAIKGRIKDTTGHNISIYYANNGVIDMNLKNPDAASSVIVKNTVGTSDNIIFKGDYSYGTSGTACFLANGTPTNWVADSVNVTGWATTKRVVGNLNTGFSSRNCIGLNFGTAAPATDQWSIGTIVKNTAPTTAKNIEYWKCIVNGGPGTWNAVGVGKGTTAQRPSLTAKDEGYFYYDTDLAKMMYWNGTAYV